MHEELKPTDDFTNTIDTTRITKAVYICDDADGTAFTVTNNASGASVNFRTKGQWHPIRIKTAISIASHTIVYAY